MDIYEVIRRPVVTEKSTALQEQSKYVFEVADAANKIQIKEAVETAFKVNVLDVNVMRVRGKWRRIGRGRGMTRSWKKAIVTLTSGQRIELFEGV